MELPVKSRKAAGQALAEALQVYKERDFEDGEHSSEKNS